MAELDRLGVADGEGLGEEPAGDGVGQRVLLALVPEPGGHVAALGERVGEGEPAQLDAAGGDGDGVGGPQGEELAPLVDRGMARVVVAALGPAREGGLEGVEPAVAQAAREAAADGAVYAGGRAEPRGFGDAGEVVG